MDSSQVKFSPGPWRCPMFHGSDEQNERARELGLDPVPALANDGARFIMAESGRVALVDCQTQYKRGQGHQTACAERDANAHLIAASPELYEALGKALHLLCHLDEPLSPLSIEDAIEDARAALKKARGEA